MKTEELAFCKAIQREFLSKFGKKLIINYSEMNDEEIINAPIKRRGKNKNVALVEERIKSLNCTKKSKLEFVKWAILNDVGFSICSQLSGISRRTMYNYAKKLK